MAFNVTKSYDENNNSLGEEPTDEDSYLNIIRMQYILMYIIICSLGLILNFYVIIKSCWMYHRILKSVTTVCVLALALTHLVCSAFLVLQLLYAWNYFNWQYGELLCKISSYVFYISMFSTAALLSLWSISSSISSNISSNSSTCCKALSSKCASIGMTLTLVLSSWTLGVILSTPSLLSRQLRYTKLGKQCMDNYDLDKEKTNTLTLIALSRFLLGVLAPILVMTMSSCMAGRGGYNMQDSCKRVICAIKVAHLVCWTPLLFLRLFQGTSSNYNFFKYGLPAATTLAAAHCIINPVLYLLVGRKINMQWMLPVQRHTAEENYRPVPLNPMR